MKHPQSTVLSNTLPQTALIQKGMGFNFKAQKGSLVFTCHFFRSSDQLFQLEKEKGYTHVLI